MLRKSGIPALLLIPLFFFLSGSVALSDLLNSDDAASQESEAAASDLPNIETIDPWRNGKRIIEAYHRAYPDRVMETAFRNQDWALRIGEQWFYWARGKLLPEEALPEAGRYSRYPFYPYPEELPPLREFSDSEVQAIEQRVASRSGSGLGRHPGLPDALWELSDRQSSEEKIKTLSFLGRPVNMHEALLETLGRVEERLLRKAEGNPELAAYIDSIVQIAGYNWRNIASSSNRSLHAYGIALDFLPTSYNREQVYWLWARTSGLRWHSLPYEERFMPPPAFVRAFEQEGFIWGGKWLYFDTIHFEYRPEILIINGLLEN